MRTNTTEVSPQKPPSSHSGSAMLIAVVAGAFILGVACLFGSHVSFQRRVEGVMTFAAATQLGLLPSTWRPSPFGPARVWFGRSADGRYEFRSAWPLIGSIPFDLFGAGFTSRDLHQECTRLGAELCHRI